MYKSDQQDKPSPRDYRQEVTNDIIRMLEEGTAQKPWESGETEGGNGFYECVKSGAQQLTVTT